MSEAFVENDVYRIPEDAEKNRVKEKKQGDEKCGNRIFAPGKELEVRGENRHYGKRPKAALEEIRGELESGEGAVGQRPEVFANHRKELLIHGNFEKGVR